MQLELKLFSFIRVYLISGSKLNNNSFLSISNTKINLNYRAHKIWFWLFLVIHFFCEIPQNEIMYNTSFAFLTTCVIRYRIFSTLSFLTKSNTTTCLCIITNPVLHRFSMCWQLTIRNLKTPSNPSGVHQKYLEFNLRFSNNLTSY